MTLLTDILLTEKDGDRGFFVPWLPEKLDFSSGGIVVASYDVMGRGPVEVPTGTGLREISWSGIFPGINRTADLGMLRGGSLRPPHFYHAILEDWRRNGTLLNLALYCYPFINLDVFLAEYSGSATGGFGDWEYTVKFREKRELTLWAIKPKQEEPSQDTSEEPKRDIPEDQTYTIKTGDCLWNIAKRHLGNGLRWTELYDLNYDALEAEAQKYGKHFTKNYPVIYTGTIIKLPAK